MKNIIEALNWRYATKVFDPQKKLTSAQLDTLLEATRLSASSYGLQPWKFIVVTNPAIRTKLREAAYNQPQLTDASHVVVFTVKKNIDAALVDEYIASIAATRKMKVEDLKGFADTMKGSIAGRTPEQAKEWASRQVYIALGTLLSAAATEQIDACPMEGFDPKKFDEILGLDTYGVESRAIVTLGFRSEGDTLPKMAKVRFPKSEVVVEVK